MIFSELEKRYRAYRLIKKWAQLCTDLECAVITDQLSWVGKIEKELETVENKMMELANES